MIKRSLKIALVVVSFPLVIAGECHIIVILTVLFSYASLLFNLFPYSFDVAFISCIIGCLPSQPSFPQMLKCSIGLAVLQILAAVPVPFIPKRTASPRSARSHNFRASSISHKASTFSLHSYLSSVVSSAPGAVLPVLLMCRMCC